MTQKSLAESMRCFPLSFRKYLANYIFKKVEKSGNRSNITVISNFLKTKNIVKASKKFWQILALYIILNEKKHFEDILQTTVWREFHNGFNILGSTRHCLASNIVISPPLSSHQPSSCSGHLQFQYSTSNAQPS